MIGVLLTESKKVRFTCHVEIVIYQSVIYMYLVGIRDENDIKHAKDSHAQPNTNKNIFN